MCCFWQIKIDYDYDYDFVHSSNVNFGHKDRLKVNEM